MWVSETNNRRGLCSDALSARACNCLVHCVVALQEEADKLMQERRGFKRMAQKMLALSVEQNEKLMEGGYYERAGGDVECPDCRLPYIEHPQILGLPTIHRVCSGKIYKL